ncbi:DUF998 domain-containing protein [Ottowia beijingensis]|uniref:DUF998 domain-containing protein n=1 Tax=Ottowia beijingensis TaxID=1207057 RepID=UPI002FDB2672
MTQLAAALAAALYAAGLFVLATLHLRYRGHDVVRDPVSDYGVGASKGLFQVNGMLGSGGALLLAWVLYRVSLPAWIALCLAASVLARTGVSWFATDLEGAPRTTAGRLHMVFAVASFTLAYVVVDNATPWIAQSAPGAWASTLTALRWVTAAGLAALVAGLVLRPLRAFFGLAERVFLIALPLWFLTASLFYATR